LSITRLKGTVALPRDSEWVGFERRLPFRTEQVLTTPSHVRSSVVLSSRSAGSSGPCTLARIKTSSSSAHILPGSHLGPQTPPILTCLSHHLVRDHISSFKTTPLHNHNHTSHLTPMPPKAAIGPEEDVKFLLTIIKQLAGTVSFPTLA
jgi:hypothetical protein